MKSDEMKPLVAYRVIKGSADGTFNINDLIWLSENGMVTDCSGFLDKEEWNQKDTNDFEVEECHDYCVLKWKDTEGLRKCEDMPFYSYKEKWDELKDRLEKAELELLQIRNGNGCTPNEQVRLDTKLSGLRIAQEYMRKSE